MAKLAQESGPSSWALGWSARGAGLEGTGHMGQGSLGAGVGLGVGGVGAEATLQVSALGRLSLSSCWH